MILPKLVLSIALAALVVAGAAFTDRRATQRAAVAEAKHPPTGRFVMVDGLRIHAHIEGSGPDLVLIHGASGSTRDFTFRMIPMLRDRYRVIAFDRPGLGWSEAAGDDALSPQAQAAMLQKAASQLGVTRPIVLGHSYGGSVAMAWAISAPQDTAAVLAISAPTLPWPGGLSRWYSITGLQAARWTTVPLISAFAPAQKAQDAIGTIFAPAAVPQGYADHIGTGLTLRCKTLYTNGRQVLFLKENLVLMAQSYRGLHLPVELIHGDQDTIVPLDIHARPLAALLPDVRLTVIDGAGHMPHHTNTDVIINAIDRAAKRAALR